MSVPHAEVTDVTGKTVTIRCPYCGATHQHTVATLGLTERFAPGCGLFRSADDRATGYRFATRRARP